MEETKHSVKIQMDAADSLSPPLAKAALTYDFCIIQTACSPCLKTVNHVPEIRGRCVSNRFKVSVT